MYGIFKSVFAGLMEKTDKKIIMQRTEDVFNSVKDYTLPMAQLDSSIGTDQEVFRLMDAKFRNRRLMVEDYNSNPTKFIAETFGKFYAERSDYESLMKESFRKDAFKTSMSFDQVQLLTFLIMAEEASAIARKYFYVLARQAADLEFSKKEKRYLADLRDDAQLTKLAVVLSAMQKGPKNIAAALKETREFIYQPDQEEIIAKVKGQAAADPMGANLIPIVGDVFVFFGEIRNMMLKNTFDRAKEEVDALRTTVYYLERRREGADEAELARIQKQIDYYNDRIAVLTKKIDDIKEDAKGYDYN